MHALDTQSPMPLYYQLAKRLLNDISTGKYPVGSRIPSEPELSRTYKIGRPTVRQATDVLVKQRRVERRRGSGTFVIEAPKRIDVLSLAGTMASIEKAGTNSTTLIVQSISAVTVDQHQTHNPFAGQHAWYMQRLSVVESSPALLESLWLSIEQFPGLDKISLEGRSLSQLAAEHYNLSATSADQSFSIAQASEEDAAMLNVAIGQPLLLVKRHVHFSQLSNAVYSELTCHTNHLEFCQTINSVPD